MKPFKQLKSMGVILGIVLIVLGGILLLFPHIILKALTIIVGIAVLFFGIIRCITIVMSWSKLKFRTIKVLLGLILICLGIFIFVNSDVTMAALGMLIGIFAILSAIDRFSIARERARVNLKNVSTIIFGLIHLAFGVGMIGASFTTMSLVVILTGAYLIISGIIVILSISFFYDF